MAKLTNERFRSLSVKGSSAVLVSAALAFIALSGLTPTQKWTAAITLITAWLWITELIPIPVASLLPLALFPLFSVLTSTQLAAAYGSPLVLLMLGGFILSRALSASQTHRYLAYRLLHAVGADSPRRLLLGLMLASASLSMWISNTATVLMLLPVTLAITETLASRRLALAALLGVAYAASIGGILTPIGTPPNLLLLETLRQQQAEVGFLQWMAWTLPVVVIMLAFLYALLIRQIPKKGSLELPELPVLDRRQKRILLIFLITAGLWMLRKQPFGGWSALTGLIHANDASVALLAVVALFIVRDGTGRALLKWDEARQIPWGILLLFAGGISIASAFKSSGLSAALATQLTAVAHWPIPAVVLMGALSVTFLTEITSNTATTAILLPILSATAAAIHVAPLVLLLPATLSASFAFMMPVATPPNAVIFSSGQVPIRQMMRTGFILNLAGTLVISLITILLWKNGLLT